FAFLQILVVIAKSIELIFLHISSWLVYQIVLGISLLPCNKVLQFFHLINILLVKSSFHYVQFLLSILLVIVLMVMGKNGNDCHNKRLFVYSFLDELFLRNRQQDC